MESIALITAYAMADRQFLMPLASWEGSYTLSLTGRKPRDWREYGCLPSRLPLRVFLDHHELRIAIKDGDVLYRAVADQVTLYTSRLHEVQRRGRRGQWQVLDADGNWVPED